MQPKPVWLFCSLKVPVVKKKLSCLQRFVQGTCGPLLWNKLCFSGITCPMNATGLHLLSCSLAPSCTPMMPSVVLEFGVHQPMFYLPSSKICRNFQSFSQEVVRASTWDSLRTTVGRILNPQTGHISPQYHIVVDEHFSTVMSSRFDHELFDRPTWNRLVQTGLEKVLDPEDIDGETVPSADWFDEWVGSSDVASKDSSTSVSEGEDVDEVPASAPTTTNETPVSEGAPLEPPSRPSTTRSGRRYQQVHHDSYVAGSNPRQKILTNPREQPNANPINANNNNLTLATTNS